MLRIKWSKQQKIYATLHITKTWERQFSYETIRPSCACLSNQSRLWNMIPKHQHYGISVRSSCYCCTSSLTAYTVATKWLCSKHSRHRQWGGGISILFQKRTSLQLPPPKKKYISMLLFTIDTHSKRRHRHILVIKRCSKVISNFFQKFHQCHYFWKGLHM